MTRFDKENISHKLYGYCITRPNESMNDTFMRAKKELINSLKKEIELIQKLTLQEYIDVEKKIK